jgi:hypothetical protein
MKAVAPPPAPARVLPKLAEEPPPPTTGKGRVAFDIVPSAGKVTHIVKESFAQADTTISGYNYAATGKTTAHGGEIAHICTTPCVADLPYGEYKLAFTTETGSDSLIGTKIVKAGSNPLVVRAAPGYIRPRTPENKMMRDLSYALGLTGLLLGPTFLGISDEETSYKTEATAFIISGLLFMALGIALDYSGQGEFQDSSYTIWSPKNGAVYRLDE